MTNHDFVDAVRRIAAAQPTYRTGGDGSDGTCDCIGLIMGAMGKEYPMHSTNYFARYELSELMPLDELEEEPPTGCLVFKARNATKPRYDLHARYKAGGRYFTGDLLDYYHVGVVTKTRPLEITHCTSTGNINGIAYDTTLDGWTHAGVLDGLICSEEEPAMSIMMKVYAENGKPVNVRQRPDVNSPKVGEIDVGTLVVMTEQADDWAKIQHGSMSGYMMSKFLLAAESTESAAQENASQMVTITMPKSAAQALYEALRKLDL